MLIAFEQNIVTWREVCGINASQGFPSHTGRGAAIPVAATVGVDKVGYCKRGLVKSKQTNSDSYVYTKFN